MYVKVVGRTGLPPDSGREPGACSFQLLVALVVPWWCLHHSNLSPLHSHNAISSASELACLSSKRTFLIVFTALLIVQHSLSNPYLSTSSKTLIPNELEFTSSKDFIIIPWVEREQGFIFKIHYVM